MTRIVLLLLALFPLSASAAGVSGLADCTIKVFDEIHRTGAWSGKAPAGCPAGIRVEKRADGAFVTAWSRAGGSGGWERTAFSTAVGFGELARAPLLTAAGRDIRSRARHLERCLDSLLTVNDPLDCRYKAEKSYLVGEETGTMQDRLVWLDDDGRHAVVLYTSGDTEPTPDPPAELFSGQPLPPGIPLILDLRR